MADTNPFANMGLGMMGGDSAFVKNYMSGGETKEGETNLLGLLGGLIGLSPKDKAKASPTAKDSSTGVAPTQYEPQTAFPDILQQQYQTPYLPSIGSAMPPPTTSLQGFMAPSYKAPALASPADPMAGFKTPNLYSAAQTTASGNHPATDLLWGVNK